jgi:hypothetical protein
MAPDRPVFEYALALKKAKVKRSEGKQRRVWHSVINASGLQLTSHVQKKNGGIIRHFLVCDRRALASETG